jgi:redox-sensitive bicupin YhaK (pirin superfamily)
MIKIRKSKDRGHANHGWLDTYHTFSFAQYFDEKFMGYRVLRVINEDRIEGGSGFPTHPHQNMEILTYIVDGALEHQDSMGTHSIIYPSEIQRMSAGKGIRHSEFNHLKDKETHLLQIWIEPDQRALTPSYEQKSFSNELATGELILLASKNGENGSISIHQDIKLYACKNHHSGNFEFKVTKNRCIWVQVVKGSININSQNLEHGDGAAIEDVENILFQWEQGAEFLVFDLP